VGKLDCKGVLTGSLVLPDVQTLAINEETIIKAVAEYAEVKSGGQAQLQAERKFSRSVKEFLTWETKIVVERDFKPQEALLGDMVHWKANGLEAYFTELSAKTEEILVEVCRLTGRDRSFLQDSGLFPVHNKLGADCIWFEPPSKTEKTKSPPPTPISKPNDESASPPFSPLLLTDENECVVCDQECGSNALGGNCVVCEGVICSRKCSASETIWACSTSCLHSVSPEKKPTADTGGDPYAYLRSPVYKKTALPTTAGQNTPEKHTSTPQSGRRLSNLYIAGEHSTHSPTTSVFAPDETTKRLVAKIKDSKLGQWLKEQSQLTKEQLSSLAGETIFGGAVRFSLSKVLDAKLCSEFISHIETAFSLSKDEQFVMLPFPDEPDSDITPFHNPQLIVCGGKQHPRVHCDNNAEGCFSVLVNICQQKGTLTFPMTFPSCQDEKHSQDVAVVENAFNRILKEASALAKEIRPKMPDCQPGSFTVFPSNTVHVGHSTPKDFTCPETGIRSRTVVFMTLVPKRLVTAAKNNLAYDSEHPPGLRGTFHVKTSPWLFPELISLKPSKTKVAAAKRKARAQPSNFVECGKQMGERYPSTFVPYESFAPKVSSQRSTRSSTNVTKMKAGSLVQLKSSNHALVVLRCGVIQPKGDSRRYVLLCRKPDVPLQIWMCLVPYSSVESAQSKASHSTEKLTPEEKKQVENFLKNNGHPHPKPRPLQDIGKKLDKVCKKLNKPHKAKENKLPLSDGSGDSSDVPIVVSAMKQQTGEIDRLKKELLRQRKALSLQQNLKAPENNGTNATVAGLVESIQALKAQVQSAAVVTDMATELEASRVKTARLETRLEMAKTGETAAATAEQQKGTADLEHQKQVGELSKLIAVQQKELELAKKFRKREAETDRRVQETMERMREENNCAKAESSVLLQQQVQHYQNRANMELFLDYQTKMGQAPGPSSSEAGSGIPGQPSMFGFGLMQNMMQLQASQAGLILSKLC
jgi:hypothetical protein